MKDDNYEEEDIYDACKGRDVDKWLREHQTPYEDVIAEKKLLEAKVLQWYSHTRDEEYRVFMDIRVETMGKIDR